MGRRSPSPQRAVFVSVGNCVPHDTKASGEIHIPRRGRWLPAQPGRGGTAWSGHTSPYNLILRLQVICTHTAYIPPAHLKRLSPGFPVPPEPFPFFRAGPRRKEQEGFRFFSAFSRHFQERIKTHKICCPAFPHPFPSLFLSTSSPVSPRECTLCTDIRPILINYPSQHNILYAICAQMPVYQIR